MPLSEPFRGQFPAQKRKPHRKSRTGCLDCRSRRVKCNEERPSCRSCVRRDVACEYPEAVVRAKTVYNETLRVPATFSAPETNTEFPPVLAELQRGTQHTHEQCMVASDKVTVTNSPFDASTPSSVSVLSQSFAPPLPAFSIRDLALLHHWTVSTSVDIFKTPEVDALWRTTLPQIGFQHAFVAHAILALAALHLAYINSSQRQAYVLEATQHHEKSLVGFHDVVEDFTIEKSEALLAWSLLNILYTFSISKQLAHSAERALRHSYKDRLLGVEWIPMIRGVDAVLGPHYNFLRTGRMSSILSLGNWDELDPGDVVADPVDKELQRTRDVWKDNNDAEVYEEALCILRKCRMYILQFDSMDADTLQQWGCNRAWAGPLAFIHFAPERYFALLHQRQPSALVLFAYFGAFFHMLDGYWFLEGWGREIVELVDELLGSYWRPWILLATSIVGLD